jgi:hypothetical protein
VKSTPRQKKMTKIQMWIHLALSVLWAAMIPIAIFTGWIESIVFVAAISIYANFAGHIAAYEAARSECLSEDRQTNGGS